MYRLEVCDENGKVYLTKEEHDLTAALRFAEEKRANNQEVIITNISDIDYPENWPNIK